MNRLQPAATLAVAALSARLMAEASVRDGFDVVALDLFGDADTRDVASQWMSLGEPATLAIDDERTLAALRSLAQRGDVSGWVAGSGFEGRPGLLAEAAALLPLVGTSPSAVCRVRDPAQFFGVLASRRIPYPPVRLGALARSLPDDGMRWLVKDPLGCGGWHVWRATPQRVAELPSHHYLQREAPGLPMSATFVANGRTAVVLGFNELTVRRFGARPYVFCGVVGPVALSEPAASQVRSAVQDLTAAFNLRGLCSLDFMRDGDAIAVLEVNPRPPASMALYGAGVMAAHVEACLYDTLPAPRPAVSNVQGTEIVFARHAAQVDDALARRLGAWPGAHDLPRAGTRLDAGDPLCSLSASGADAASVRAALRQARETLLEMLETPT
ncbi:ATP-grasp domain-containing protein [Sphaerotilaceae bacterium SBD11-9]